MMVCDGVFDVMLASEYISCMMVMLDRNMAVLVNACYFWMVLIAEASVILSSRMLAEKSVPADSRLKREDYDG